MGVVFRGHHVFRPPHEKAGGGGDRVLKTEAEETDVKTTAKMRGKELCRTSKLGNRRKAF